MSIKENLITVKKSISKLEIEYGRVQGTVELLAVSKTKPLDFVMDAYNSGQRLFGENRVNEAEIKVPALPEDAEFHMIGHLQSNKVQKACKYFKCIQSVDSLKIAKKIDSTCNELGKIMDIYLDINIVNDVNKSGFIINDDFFLDFEEILLLKNINVIGLMCIGAHVEDKDQIRKSFSDLKSLLQLLQKRFELFKGDKLSMGMSNDYPEAIMEGSTMVRIGSNIFGSRM